MMVFFGPQCRDDHYYVWMDFTARHQLNKTSQYFARLLLVFATLFYGFLK